MSGRYRISTFLLASAATLFVFVLPSKATFLAYDGVVIRIVDEDTVIVQTPGEKKLLIRLYGIDGPEVRHGNKPGQPYGEEAKAALQAMLLGKKVRVDVIDKDRRKRMVGMIYAGTINVNEEMVKEGWAWAYGEYHVGSYLSDFIQAESEAKKQKRGLWQQDNPVPPWEHRNRLYMKDDDTGKNRSSLKPAH